MTNDAIEQKTQVLRDAGDLDGAMSQALCGYGAELLGFLEALHPPDEAQEVFARAAERMWKALGRFRGECTLRTWMYAVAINESRRFRAEGRRRNEESLPSGAEVAIARRTETPLFMQTGPKEQLRVLRQTLNADEQMLLILRVDRSLAWEDVARALAKEPDKHEVRSSDTAVLRKRLERIKDKLRRRAIERGLLP